MSTLRTVDRAFLILRHIAQHPDGQTVSQISAEMKLAKSTISRLLATMEKWEVVERDSKNRFFIGDEPARWVSKQPKIRTLASIAQPTLQKIAEDTGEAVALCMREGLQVVYVDYVQSNQDIQVRDWTGEKFALNATSSGKVLLAYASAETINLMLGRPLQPYTDKTITSASELKKQLSLILERGYDIADEEHGEGILGFSVPVFDANEQVVAALNLYGPRFRLNTEFLQQTLIARLREGASFLSSIIKLI